MNLIVPLIIVVEIIGGIVLTSPLKKQPQNIKVADHQNVLGEEDNPTPTPDNATQETADTPTPDQAQAQPSSAPAIETVTAEPTQIQDTLTPEQTQENLGPTTTETIFPSETQPQNQEELNPTAELNSSADNQKTTLNNLNDSLQDQESNLYNNLNSQNASDAVSNENKNELNGENNQIDQAATPLEKADLLVQFSNKNIQDINSDTKDNNLDSAVFHAEKFSYQLDKALDTIQQLPPDQANQVKQEISSLCQNADPIFRQQELLVGEVDSQTVETARGKCFDYIYGQ